MDTAFDSSAGSYALESQFAILADLGFDGGYLSLWDEESWSDLDRVGDVALRHGLQVASVYHMIDLATVDRQRLLDLPARLPDSCHLELAIDITGAAPSSTKFDPNVLRLLDDLATRALQHAVTISLYHHVGVWLEQLSDAVRLCSALDHPAVGLTFSGYHWYATSCPPLADGAPWASFVRRVNLSGVTQGSTPDRPVIVPLDAGELDNFALLGEIRGAGYRDWVGVQGFGVRGDVYQGLARSVRALRDIDRRLVAHPEWADMRRRTGP